MNYALQHLVMPNLTFGAPTEMYVRLGNDEVHALMSEDRLLFRTGGRISLDTFFNSITIQAWKKNTRVDDLQLHLKGSGRFILRFGLHRIGHAHRWLSEYVITLDSDDEFILPIEAWSELESGILYFAMEALEPGHLQTGYFSTKTPPEREVRLGIVITHFNRKELILPAMERIRKELLSDPLYKGRIELVVVDNSQNITDEEAQEVTLLPNKNLGGSGGFTRGLLHLKDRQDFTHCLFMDDDASCEIESIKRAFNFASHSLSQRLAISGSMLREIEPFRLYEKGAKFDGFCKPLKSGMDMRRVCDLLISEAEFEKPDYGGWWFFCFKIKDVQELPFPFFVRGDDSRFSITNQFNIVTMNGVSTWGGDFAFKSEPLTEYFDFRYHILHHFLILEKSSFSIARFCLRWVLGQIFSYNYVTAKFLIKAIRDVYYGPKTFLEDLDAAKIRAEIAKFGTTEKMKTVNRSEYRVVYSNGAETRKKRFIRYLTLNGVFLPKAFFKNDILFQRKSGVRLSEVFGYKKILYEDEPSSKGYIAEFDRIKSFTLLVKLVISVTQMFLFKNHMKRKYEEKVRYMTSESFWRDVFCDKI